MSRNNNKKVTLKENSKPSSNSDQSNQTSQNTQQLSSVVQGNVSGFLIDPVSLAKLMGNHLEIVTNILIKNNDTKSLTEAYMFLWTNLVECSKRNVNEMRDTQVTNEKLDELVLNFNTLVNIINSDRSKYEEFTQRLIKLENLAENTIAIKQNQDASNLYEIISDQKDDDEDDEENNEENNVDSQKNAKEMVNKIIEEDIQNIEKNKSIDLPYITNKVSDNVKSGKN